MVIDIPGLQFTMSNDIIHVAVTNLEYFRDNLKFRPSSRIQIESRADNELVNLWQI